MVRSTEDAENESGRATDTARAAAGEVASSAKSQARSLTGEARTEVEHLTGDVRSRIQEETESQARRASQNLRQWSQDLESMAEQSDAQSPVPNLVHQVAQGSHGAADFLDTRGVNGLIDEIRDFAGRQPMAFLAGAAVAGFALGRVLKVSPEESDRAESEEADASRADRTSRPTMPRQGEPAAGETVPSPVDPEHRYRVPGGEEG